MKASYCRTSQKVNYTANTLATYSKKLETDIDSLIDGHFQGNGNVDLKNQVLLEVFKRMTARILDERHLAS